MANEVRIRPMKPREVRRHHGVITFPVAGWIGKVGRKVVGMGGLAWRFGRCDLWLEVRRPELCNPRQVVREARRMLRVAVQMGETEVFCLRDEHPNSEKLLRLVGFTPYAMQEVDYRDGTAEQREVWLWRHLPQ